MSLIVQRDVSVVKCGVSLRVVMLALGLELVLYLIRRILIFFVPSSHAVQYYTCH